VHLPSKRGIEYSNYQCFQQIGASAFRSKLTPTDAMCGKITRQSRWNLRPAVRVRQYRTKPRKYEEGLETGWRASRSTG
jgi:hypothetical protein